MTAMAELAGNTALHGAAEPEKPEAVADETSLIEAFELTLDISQDVELPECAASEETDSREQQEDGQQDDRQQEDGQTSPPVPESGSKWVVGAQCRAVWSEDGRAYPATVASLDGERCRVRFDGYGNEEDVELSALRSPDASLQTQRQNSQDWKPGSRCRAVYSEDGLVYPAVVLWVKGQRCGVRFDNYNNEEEQDVGSLLNPDELRGPSRAAAAKGSSRTSSVTSSEENQRERGAARRSAWRDDEHNSSWVKEKPSKVEKEEKKRGNQRRDGAEKPTDHSFSFFPPFPPPPESGSGGPVSFIPPPPPPPPLWTFGGKESGSSPAINATSSMLMLWYMCGFHTGSFMSQRGLWDELGRSSFLFHSALLHLFEYF
ncbi:survival motor neuron protein-like isoform X2 [Siniperca chuatsi]|uniref:survival motor neuron protein-like isoform X2 n=1 Tax=Siniperca chuatsi TaxID=119488 RepID=UPI001CE10F70|nr:survival motor neuron protein-like isoform X2 [Siniperca chuatsi]